MGTNKALLPFGGESLLELALRKTKAICATPVIVGERERYAAYGHVVEDKFPGCGPLGGIHAALCTTQTDLNLILSVDMPLMKSDFLLWLMRTAADGTELAVVPEAGGRPQPLCAVYRRGIRPAIEEALKAGDFKVNRIFRLVPIRFISEHEIRLADFSVDMFSNVNTPEEYETAIRQASRISLETAKG
jgi:molybdopterin-guanine dinucleotide biosynthesis protein A